MNNLNARHLEHLLPEDRKRYYEKLTVGCEKLPDPLVIEDRLWSEDILKWPGVQYENIWYYLVITTGKYTAEYMKTYKSSDGYNLFVSNHVEKILCYDANESVCFLKAMVAPSQKVSKKKQWHTTWVCVEKTNAIVNSVHCSCKDGLDEVCSHIAALLFKVEATIRLDHNHPDSATYIWNKHYREECETVETVENIFGRTNRRTRRDDCDVKSPTKEEQEEALRELKKICPNACIFTA